MSKSKQELPVIVLSGLPQVGDEVEVIYGAETAFLRVALLVGSRIKLVNDWSGKFVWFILKLHG